MSDSTTSPHPHRSHTLPPTTALAAQVGGHAGVQITEDGSLLLKPALAAEVAFYQLVRDGANASTVPTSGLSLLLPWIPKFIGLLSLEGRIEDADDGDEPSGSAHQIVPATGTNAPKQTLVLDNLTHGFTKPCILDVKLGTVLYGEDASPEKKQRMIRTAEQTTSLTTGVRLTGFQVSCPSLYRVHVYIYSRYMRMIAQIPSSRQRLMANRSNRSNSRRESHVSSPFTLPLFH